MSQFIARLVVDLDEGTADLSSEGLNEYVLHAKRPSVSAAPFTAAELMALDLMHSEHNYL